MNSCGACCCLRRWWLGWPAVSFPRSTAEAMPAVVVTPGVSGAVMPASVAATLTVAPIPSAAPMPMAGAQLLTRTHHARMVACTPERLCRLRLIIAGLRRDRFIPRVERRLDSTAAVRTYKSGLIHTSAAAGDMAAEAAGDGAIRTYGGESILTGGGIIRTRRAIPVIILGLTTTIMPTK